MYIYTFDKVVNSDKLNEELKTVPHFSHIDISGTTVDCHFTETLDAGEEASLNSIITNHNPVDLNQIYQQIISNAITFGNKLITEFAAENVIMGITQDGMTKTVRTNLMEVTSCLSTGSLYDAITEIKTLPEEKKDPKYITNARLIVFLNKIETYLNIPITTSL